MIFSHLFANSCETPVLMSFANCNNHDLLEVIFTSSLLNNNKIWSVLNCTAGCFCSELLSAASAYPGRHLQFIKHARSSGFILSSFFQTASALDFKKVKKCTLLYSWCWGLDFEMWDGCRLVCLPFASGWHSHIENVNYWTGLAVVPREQNFLLGPSWASLCFFFVKWLKTILHFLIFYSTFHSMSGRYLQFLLLLVMGSGVTLSANFNL